MKISAAVPINLEFWPIKSVFHTKKLQFFKILSGLQFTPSYAIVADKLLRKARKFTLQ